VTISLDKLKMGGKVSVTLEDGARVLDAPISGYHTRIGTYLTIANNQLYLNNAGGLSGGIKSIDAYTPPLPDWCEEDVYAVTDCDGYTWTREPEGQWDEIAFRCEGSPARQLVRTAEQLEEKNGPITILARLV